MKLIASLTVTKKMIDQTYMAQALQLAQQGLYSTHPNPRVGCVIVKNGVVVGQGWHQCAGEPHAEVHALREAGTQAKGATAYVTLEPCSHHGRTPPCANALVSAGVARVVTAMQDPNPQVAGTGLARLQAAGVEVISGVLEEQARSLNCGFIKRMETGLPWVRVKLAMSLDGRTAMANGESKWITGPAARSDVQRLRARSSLVITGADTVLQDQARLTVRSAELGLDPWQTALAEKYVVERLLIDSQLRVPTTAAFFQAGKVLVATLQRVANQSDIEYLCLTEQNGKVNLVELLKKLAVRGTNEVLVEAGPRLAGAFVEQGLVDELYIYMAPKLMGALANPLLSLPFQHMSQAVDLRIQDIRAIGHDWRIIAQPAL
ncbi:bifunctional diaminohydroxyphosphoribosylaminopyrimidine deaminase/5-amino-6-(5-phosphoribosylamino)uracil reductase RibD [Pseudomonas sp. F1_0610]|uniref:bifunctional diaminohydroxyphosphoribosylaminopyrimidine deaminase/5-amino-6-(5-phosphoribosylamino)uracil reductase RibD n=1 Tax=Pseudomonas sp. F1_0610 TaxID=3114284 RepID=UPI0039C10452